MDCDTCQHFQGGVQHSRFEFRCAKGHPPESDVVLIRFNGCADFLIAGRDQVIFRRHKGIALLEGDATLKKRQTQATRTANGLAVALADFGDLMDSDQTDAINTAVKTLRRLSTDIERAAALAKAYKAREDASRETERQRRDDELAAVVLGGWSEEQIVECAVHLAAFDSPAAQEWHVALRGRRMLLDGGVWSPNDLARQFKLAVTASRRAELFAELRRDLARSLETLNRPQGPLYATRADFDAYRQLLRDQAAAKASVAALISTASR
ncbi:MAG: hypothetical protein E6Q67_05020 [Roseateles sp.]|nr:MAG: hypothetical protein E6Q67_05020 [Roseateles sp.]